MSSRRPRAIVSWSSGKDSAWALETVRRAGVFEVVGLLTTVTEEYARVSMHGVREEILDLQAARTCLACVKVKIPPRCTNAVYEDAIGKPLAEARRADVTHVVFGDLFLEDVRRYRERLLDGSGIEPVFPLWAATPGSLRAR